MANPRKDHTGEKYGRLTALRFSHREPNETFWVFRCDCGEIVTKPICKVVSLQTQSCGCLQKERTSDANTKHGFFGTRIYRIWVSMKKRCHSKNDCNYKYYGERGISVCEEWRNDFKAFYDWATSNGYQDNLSIDRIDVDGNYEPLNCRWATQKEQANNRRNTFLVYYDGSQRTTSEISNMTGIKRQTLYSRFRRRGEIG